MPEHGALREPEATSDLRDPDFLASETDELKDVQRCIDCPDTTFLRFGRHCSRLANVVPFLA
jgi:hypothetical protein